MIIKCTFCDEEIVKFLYSEHLGSEHYNQLEALFAYQSEVEENDSTVTGIKNSTISLEHNLFIKDAINETTQKYNINYQNEIKSWKPNQFKLEATTVWSFPNRGSWATHNGKYRGNWSPYIPRNIILRYSKEDDTVLDQFMGSGTTLIETKLLRRKGIGIEINKDVINIAKHNLNFNMNTKYDPVIHNGDARKLNSISDESIDLICTHPPYANIIKYSTGLKGDLSHYDIEEFILEMGRVASESFRVLKPDKYCAILIGDTRRNKHMIPLGFKVMNVFLNAGFVLKETVIKEQHNCKATRFWYQRSIDYNFMLIAHEYLFVFRKP